MNKYFFIGRVEQFMKTCPLCGKINGANTKFCTNCGAEIDSVASTQQSTYRRDSVSEENHANINDPGTPTIMTSPQPPRPEPSSQSMEDTIALHTQQVMDLPFTGDALFEDDWLKSRTSKHKQNSIFNSEMATGLAHLRTNFFQKVTHKTKFEMKLVPNYEVTSTSNIDISMGISSIENIPEQYLKSMQFYQKNLMSIPTNDPLDNYLKQLYSGKSAIDFGSVLLRYNTTEFPQLKEIKNISLKTPYPLEDFTKKEFYTVEKSVNYDINNYLQKFVNNPEIAYDLDACNTDLQFKSPIEIRVEIEHPLISLLKMLDFKEFKDAWIEKTLESEALIEKLKEKIIQENLFGDYSALLDNLKLATVKLIVDNNSHMQIFNNNVFNLQMETIFNSSSNKLFLPSSLKIEFPPNIEGRVDVKQQKIFSFPADLAEGESFLFKYHLDWGVLKQSKDIHFLIKGMILDPTFINQGLYITPMGFPVKLTPSGDVFWNPGVFTPDPSQYIAGNTKWQPIQNIFTDFAREHLLEYSIKLPIHQLIEDPNQFLSNMDEVYQEIISFIKIAQFQREVH